MSAVLPLPEPVSRRSQPRHADPRVQNEVQKVRIRAALPQKRQDLEAAGIGHGLEDLRLRLQLCLIQPYGQRTQFIHFAFGFIRIANKSGHPIYGFFWNT